MAFIFFRVASFGPIKRLQKAGVITIMIKPELFFPPSVIFTTEILHFCILLLQLTADIMLEDLTLKVNYFHKESCFVCCCFVFCFFFSFHKEATSVLHSRHSDVRLMRVYSRLIKGIALTMRLDKGCIFWYFEMSKQIFPERWILEVQLKSGSTLNSRELERERKILYLWRM